MAESAFVFHAEKLSQGKTALLENFLSQSRAYHTDVADHIDLWRQTVYTITDSLSQWLTSCTKVDIPYARDPALNDSVNELGNELATLFKTSGLLFDQFGRRLKRLRSVVIDYVAHYMEDTGQSISPRILDYFDALEIASFTRWVRDDAAKLKKDLREARHSILYEKKRYFSIFQKISEPAFVIDGNMNFVDVNHAFEACFGLRADEVVGKSCCDVVGRKACTSCALEEALKQQTSFSDIQVSIDVNNEIKIFSMAGAALGDMGADLPGGLVILQDLTEKMKILDALEESEEKYRSLVENVPEVTWRVDQDGNLLFISPNVRKLTGYKPEEIIASGPAGRSELIHEDDAEKVREEFGLLFAENKKFNIRYRFKTKDGDWIWLHDRAGNIYEKDGVWMADGVVSDITELQRVQEELEEYRDWLEDLVDERTEELKFSNEQLKHEIDDRQQAEEALIKLALRLKRSNTELEQFAHVASHDLKEPLLLIIAFSERLLHRYGQVLTGSGEEYLDRILRAARKMQQLVDGLLQLSRVTSSNRQFEPIDLTDLIHEVVQDLEESINLAGGRVEFGPLHTLNGDRVQVRQLFQNMITNSLKYRREYVPPVITVKSTLIGDEFCEITVQDNGIGFDEKFITKIFQPFERLHEIPGCEGSGIGLTTCKKIVSRHGGEITARSKPDQGATFIVRLPLRQAVDEGAAKLDLS
ncbi:MAG: PAS domain S-box protein [Proteobacteria bacterium]|nr:PAS domain S-box protein [Pseudomonadota bacterium]MBU1711105.1 PAS domain S-box protein [Pseudomonadota bacterium]